jgi:hypothetical protein
LIVNGGRMNVSSLLSPFLRRADYDLFSGVQRANNELIALMMASETGWQGSP